MDCLGVFDEVDLKVRSMLFLIMLVLDLTLTPVGRGSHRLTTQDIPGDCKGFEWNPN